MGHLDKSCLNAEKDTRANEEDNGKGQIPQNGNGCIPIKIGWEPPQKIRSGYHKVKNLIDGIEYFFHVKLSRFLPVLPSYRFSCITEMMVLSIGAMPSMLIRPRFLAVCSAVEPMTPKL